MILLLFFIVACIFGTGALAMFFDVQSYNSSVKRNKRGS